jgi:hypothetical protein
MRVDQALDAYPLRRMILFWLLRNGKVKSFILKRDDATQGCRLIDRTDLDRYLEEEFEKEMNHREGRSLAHPTSEVNQTSTGKAGRDQ